MPLLTRPARTLPLLALLLASCGKQAASTGQAPGGAAKTTVAAAGAPSQPTTTAPVTDGGGVGTGQPGAASYAPWPAAGHDARHTGAAPVEGPTTGRVLWRRKLEGAVVPGPIVGQGSVAYAASNGGVLHAVDVRTGKDRWHFDGGGTYGSDLSTSPLLLPDGLLVWPGPNSTLFGLEAATGHRRWTITLDGMGHSPQLAPNGDVIVGDGSGTVRALHLHGTAAPTTRWMLDTGGTSYGNPVVGAAGIVYTTVDSALVAIDRGRLAWRFNSGGQVEVSAAVASGGTIVFGSNDRRLYGISPAGKERWRYDLGDLTYSSPSATRDGLVYIGDHFGRVTAISAADGTRRLAVLGQGRTPGSSDVGVWSEPAIDRDHRLYFGTRLGHVFGFDAAGKRLFDVDAGAGVDSYPALTGAGSLLVGSESGELLAIG